MSEGDGFTNRRGHSVSGLKAVVDQLPEPEHKLASPKPVRRRRRVRISALQLRIALIVLIILALVPVGIGEYAAAGYTSEVQKAKQTIAGQLAGVVQAQKSAVTSPMLKNAADGLSTVRDGLCSGGVLDNIAALYPRAKQAYEACNAYRSNVVLLQNNVTEAAAQLAYLEQLQVLLGTVTKPLEDQFAVLTSQQELWQTFVDGLKQQSIPGSFSAAHSGLIAQAETIRDQWIALVDASNNFDSTKFRAARAKLTTVYDAFRVQNSAFLSAISAKQQTLLTSVKSLE